MAAILDPFASYVQQRGGQQEQKQQVPDPSTSTNQQLSSKVLPPEFIEKVIEIPKIIERIVEKIVEVPVVKVVDQVRLCDC